MFWHKKRTEDPVPIPAYYPAGTMRIGEPHLGSEAEEDRSFRIKRMDASALIGASVLESALFTGDHHDAQAFDELSRSLLVIEQKLHAGQYDAQAMPLIEAFLDELKTLARIEVDRNGVNAQRINDMKVANAAAYDAVSKAREERERMIEGARLRSLEQVDARKRQTQLRAERKEQAQADRAVRKASRRQAAHERKQARIDERVRKRRARADQRQREDEAKRARADLEYGKSKCAAETQRAEMLVRQAQAQAEVEAAWRQMQASVQAAERAEREASAVQTLQKSRPEQPQCDLAGQESISAPPMEEVAEKATLTQEASEPAPPPEGAPLEAAAFVVPSDAVPPPPEGAPLEIAAFAVPLDAAPPPPPVAPCSDPTSERTGGSDEEAIGNG